MKHTTVSRWLRRAGALVLASLAVVGCNHGPDPAIGTTAAARAAEHVQRGRASMESLAQGLQTAMSHAGIVLAPAFTGTLDLGRIHNRLHGLHDDQTAIGRELAFFPTWFLAAVGPDGKAIAGDRTPTDNLPGRDLGAAFPCIRPALGGTPGVCVGDFVSVDGQPPRTYLLAAAPIGTGDSGVNPTQQVVVAAIPFGRLARAIRADLELRTLHDDVQLSVGFIVQGHVSPSGNDNDIPAMYLVPGSLVRRIPTDADARLVAGHGNFTFTFAENEGSHLWGAAVGQVPALGPGVSLVVFRTPLRQ